MALALVSEYAYRVRYIYKNLLSYRRNLLLELEKFLDSRTTLARAQSGLSNLVSRGQTLPG